MKNINKALLAAQIKIKSAVKDKANSHFKSTYATLESVIDAVKEPLNEAGIFIINTTNRDNLLTTSLVHAESGEMVSSEFQISSASNPQQFGSASTYGKRYNLTSLLSLPTEDDDGNEASLPKPQKEQYKPKDGKYRIKAGQNKGKTMDELGNDVIFKSLEWAKDKELKGALLDDINEMKSHLTKQGLVLP